MAGVPKRNPEPEAKRTPVLPDPTAAEQGYPGFLIDGWFAFIGPAKMPAEESRRQSRLIARKRA